MYNATHEPESTNANQGADQTQSAVLSPLNYSTWLRDECRDRRIPVPSNATPAEVIPWVKKAIARHNQIGELIPINVESRKPWQALADDWQEFLQKLENLETAAKIRPAIPNQPLPIRPPSGQNLPQLANTLPQLAKNLPELAKNLPELAKNLPKVASPLPPPDFPNQKSSIVTSFREANVNSGEQTRRAWEAHRQSSMTSASTSESESPSPKKNPQSEIPNLQSDDPPKSELEYADLTDGFATERERLAVARSEFQDHLAHRPVRFAKLTPEQRAGIFALLESGFSSRAIAKILADPPPEGVGIRVSKTAVNDWRRQYKTRLVNEANRRKAEAQRHAALQILDETANSDAAFQQAAEHMLKLRILTGEDEPLEQLDQLVATLTTLRKQSLAERKQTHAENSP